ncbi:hypothetical protein COBT_000057 [Conglomerata obtusa]
MKTFIHGNQLPKRINSCFLNQIKRIGSNFILQDQKIKKIEITGTVVETHGKFIRLIDFYGLYEIYGDGKKYEGTYRFLCRLFGTHDIKLFLVEAKLINLYEEMFMLLELLEHNK